MTRLKQRVERLENTRNDGRTIPIVVDIGDTVDAAKARHFEEHPENIGADLLIIHLIDPTER